MENQKLETLLNLALETTNEEREKSDDLNAGYNEQEKTWELIVRYSGSLAEVEDMGIEPEILLGGYAILKVPQHLIDPISRLAQIEYIEKLSKNDILFSLGAAGTGKTYIAIAYAVNLLKNNQVAKIILTRPAVEAGESLGFLPGDLKEKVDPYLRPLYDALYDTLGMEQTEDLIAKNVIEIAPLAYMRGRTLENAFIILDEAQNATTEQIKMFLTRLGFHSKMVITGDPSQVDLKDSRSSGLKFAAKILEHINGISTISFASNDVVRHPLVAKIIEAFEKSKN